MKNRIKYFAITLVLTAFVLGCTKLEHNPSFPKSSAAFSITASKASVAAAATDSLSEVISFTWNDPKYSVGLENSKFTLMVDSVGKNFAKFESKSFTGVLLGSVLGKELNAMALKSGGAVSQPITLEVKVVASQSNNDQPKISNVVQITVTPYGDLTLDATSKGSDVVICTSGTATELGDTLTWNQAFNGYTGVRTYSLEYAKAGTGFASPTSISVTGLSKTFAKRELNQIAQLAGVAAPGTGDVDFRIKASNESGTILYSNTVTISISTYVAFNSIGLIGDFTSWGNDVDLYRPDPINAPGDWKVTVYLSGGGVKFRADDAWTTAWGAAGWPSGTSTTTGGNIPVGAAGYYAVTFNVVSGAYAFNLVSVTDYTSPGISVIGDATPGGWGADTPLTQSVSDHNVWTGSVAMTSGGAFKFRTTGDWATNWGLGYSSPGGHSGWSVGNGGNIPVSYSTTYFVYINTATGQFFYGDATNNANAGTAYGSIGIIGDGTPGGWGTDTPLIKNPANPYEWSGKMALTAASAKFRTVGDWATNWGSNTFPSGIGTQGGANISVTTGAAQITFNTATGEYYFTY